MSTVTISKHIAKRDDLVMIPKREYEEFTKWKSAVRVRLSERWFWTPEWQRKEAEADRAIRHQRVSHSFSSHRALLAALERKRQ
ncbi:MAG: hypothetical protein Q8R35_00085 [bacterium]|nr:hypothetical protein [bacterium]